MKGDGERGRKAIRPLRWWIGRTGAVRVVLPSVSASCSAEGTPVDGAMSAGTGPVVPSTGGRTAEVGATATGCIGGPAFHERKGLDHLDRRARQKHFFGIAPGFNDIS